MRAGPPRPGPCAARRNLEGGSVELSWTARYSERDWLFESEGFVEGQALNITITGYLWGQDDESWTIIYGGHGMLGEEPVRMHGQADWIYDTEEQDYIHMDLRHVKKLGEESFWGFVFGAEVIVGGTIGAIGAIGGTTIATGGAALIGAPLVGAKGALVGAGALVTVSAGAKSLLDDPEAPAPPLRPERPDPPDPGQPLVPEEGSILVAISWDGDMLGSSLDGRHVLSGEYFAEDRFAQGDIMPLNE